MKFKPDVNLVLQEQHGSVTIPASGVVIGRSSSCFLQIDDPEVSRRHLRISFEEVPLIMDLGSKNGTLLNGQPLTEAQPLNEGDVIGLGSRRFTVKFIDTLIKGGESEVTLPGLIASRNETWMGLGALGNQELNETCPCCGHLVVEPAHECSSCGFSWSRARTQTPTRNTPVVQASDPPDQATALCIQARYFSSEVNTAGQLRSISVRGAFFETTHFDRVGASCLIQIPLDNNDVVELHGFVQQVIRRGVEFSGMGIEFTELSPEVEDWLLTLEV